MTSRSRDAVGLAWPLAQATRATLGDRHAAGVVPQNVLAKDSLKVSTRRGESSKIRKKSLKNEN